MTIENNPNILQKTEEEEKGRKTELYVVVAGKRPRGGILSMNTTPIGQSILNLRGVGPEEIEGVLEKIIDKDKDPYKKVEYGGYPKHYSRPDTSHPLYFIAIEGSENSGSIRIGTPLSDEARESQKAFFQKVAESLFGNVRIIPLENWFPRTLKDLEFLSFSLLTNHTSKELNDIKGGTVIKIPETDPNVNYVLNLTGVKALQGTIYCCLDKVKSPEVVFGQNHQSTLCYIPELSFHVQSRSMLRVSIAASVGFFSKGGKFGFNPEEYWKKRGLSDLVLANFTYSSIPKWSPLNYDISKFEERHKGHATVLARIWELVPLQERKGMVRKLWDQDFGPSDIEPALNLVEKEAKQFKLKPPTL